MNPRNQRFISTLALSNVDQPSCLTRRPTLADNTSFAAGPRAWNVPGIAFRVNFARLNRLPPFDETRNSPFRAVLRLTLFLFASYVYVHFTVHLQCFFCTKRHFNLVIINTPSKMTSSLFRIIIKATGRPPKPAANVK